MERTLAAVDLGSNSFHLVVARHAEGEFTVLDKVRDRVQLAAGLRPDGQLDEDAQARALECLSRMGQRLSALTPDRVRAVGTNTLRKASNSGDFRARAEAALGHPIEVISGTEEARLVYGGVTHGIEDTGPRLVVDIGGGSTECIIGRGHEITVADSLYMGCVSYTQRFFPDGRITAARLDEAVIAARLELGPIHRRYRALGWTDVYGSSGTIMALQNVAMENGWADHAITKESLAKTREALLEAGHVDAVRLPGVKTERAPVLPGGFAVLSGVFRSLKLDRMMASKRALREGVLYELAGRRGPGDVRQKTVRRVAERYGSDDAQAARVGQVALNLLAQLVEPWALDHETARRYLSWAAQLHEIGTAISFAGFHKHGAYIVAKSDLPGFSRAGQAQLAALVLCARRKIDKTHVQSLVGGRADDAVRWAIPLRLGLLLNRTRSPNPRPAVEVEAGPNHLCLNFPEGWLEARPLTQADLATEAGYLATVGVELTWG